MILKGAKPPAENVELRPLLQVMPFDAISSDGTLRGNLGYKWSKERPHGEWAGNMES